MRVLIKGAGDLATGIAHRLFGCGYEILMTDIAVPTAVRRTVSFSRAIYEGKAIVEGVEAVYCGRMDIASPVGEVCKNMDLPVGEVCKNTEIPVDEVCKNIEGCISAGKIAVIVDPDAAVREYFKPDVIIDAIIAKKNLGTRINDAPLVIGVGPGFTAGADCHCVIETKRGHYLGKVMYSGSAIPNTGVPGDIGGFTTERIIRATAEGMFIPVKQIGDRVEAGDLVARVMKYSTDVEELGNSKIDGNGSESQKRNNIIIPESGKSVNNDVCRETDISPEEERYCENSVSGDEQATGNSGIPVYSEISGIIRGLLQKGVCVNLGMKCGDVDPRCEQEHCYTISDKARAIGGGALEAISRFEHRRNGTGIVLLAAGEGKRYGSNKLLEEINGKRMFESAVDAAFRAMIGLKGYAARNYVPASNSVSASDHVTAPDHEILSDYPAVPGLVIVTGYDEIAEYASHRGFKVVRNNRPELGISESVKLGLAGVLNADCHTLNNKINKDINKDNIKGADKELYQITVSRFIPDNVVFSVCDQPGLTEESFRRLIDAYAASDKGLACMGRQVTEDNSFRVQQRDEEKESPVQTAEERASSAIIKNRLGNPCIFSKKYFGELMELVGDTGGKRVIMAHRDDLQVVYASDSELADIDYPRSK